MSAKKPAWYDEYNRVSQRQQEYLKRIQDLRRRIISKDEQLMMLAIEKQRHLQFRRQEPRYPTMRKMQQQVIHFGPQPFPQRTCVLHDRNQFYMAPVNGPKILPPVTKNKKQEKEQLDSIKTEYEPFEELARRNKIHFNRYDYARSPHLLKPSHGRPALAITTVCVKTGLQKGPQIETPIISESPMEYITDISSQKHLVSH